MKTVTLRIKKKEFDLIKSGIKKVEWRTPSNYNNSLLFSKDDPIKKDGNPEINQIQFINGYAKDAPRLLVECKKIRRIKAMRDWEIPVDNFVINDFATLSDYNQTFTLTGKEQSVLRVKQGQTAIEISLGEILPI